MEMVRRICFFGGPGCGKSSTAAHIFSELKKKNYSTELVTEYVKKWTYIDRKPNGWDQLYIFGQQVYREFVVLNHGFDYLVTDSPIFLSAFYAKYNHNNYFPELLELAKKFEEDYNSVNIFLQRRDKPYAKEGRFHSYKDAVELDNAIISFLREFDINFASIFHNDINSILDFVLGNIVDV